MAQHIKEFKAAIIKDCEATILTYTKSQLILAWIMPLLALVSIWHRCFIQTYFTEQRQISAECNKNYDGVKVEFD